MERAKTGDLPQSAQRGETGAGVRSKRGKAREQKQETCHRDTELTEEAGKNWGIHAQTPIDA